MTLKRRTKSNRKSSPERSIMTTGTVLESEIKEKISRSSCSSELVPSSFLKVSSSSLLATLYTSVSSQFTKRKTRGIFSTSWVLFLMVLNFVSSSSLSSSSKHLWSYIYLQLWILFTFIYPKEYTEAYLLTLNSVLIICTCKTKFIFYVMMLRRLRLYKC